MRKGAFVVHGWEGAPEKDWFPWLKEALRFRGFKTEVLRMPNPDKPKIEEWIPFLEKHVKKIDKNTFFIGHSIGCQTILRYLEKIPEGKVGGLIFVAGWFSLNLETDKEKKIAKPWMERPIDFKKIREKTENIVAIFSDNDPFVSLSDGKVFEQLLKAKLIIEKGKGHFTAEDGVEELPVVLEELLRMIKG